MPKVSKRGASMPASPIRRLVPFAEAAKKRGIQMFSQDVLTFSTNLKTRREKKTMKSASGKRHPGEKHSPGEETSKPQRCSEALG